MGTPVKRPFDAAVASPIPHRFQAAVSTISTAQILQASGYSAAEAAALRALSDIAGRYIKFLGRNAVAFVEPHGRTEPNVANVILALEEHMLGGFPGVSNPTRPVLCSGALTELARFVTLVTEVPFAKTLLRGALGSRSTKVWGSFMAAEREPLLRHVPHWLPRFPEGWDERLHSHGEAASKDKDTREEVTVIANGNLVENGRRAVLENREKKVSFLLVDKRRKRRPQTVPLEKCGGAMELFVEKPEKILYNSNGCVCIEPTT